jgi:hypothetical protein
MGWAYWPEWEYWVLWQSWVTMAVAVGAVMIGFVTGRWGRITGIAILAFVTLYAIALTEKIKTKPDRDYAYFFVPNGAPVQSDGKVLLHRHATGPLSHIDIAFIQDGKNPFTDRYQYFFPGVQLPEGSGYAFVIAPGDWWIDLDTLPIAGQVRERLNIVVNNGKVETLFVQVKRKFGRQEILCETPQRGDIPLCL